MGNGTRVMVLVIAKTPPQSKKLAISNQGQIGSCLLIFDKSAAIHRLIPPQR